MKLAICIIVISLLSGCKLDDNFDFQPATIIYIGCLTLILTGVIFHELYSKK